MPRLIFPLLLCSFLIACTTTPVSDYALGHDFSQYKTFTFVIPPESAVVSIDSKRIEDETAAQLKVKGLSQTQPQSADLQINYRLEMTTELESNGGTFGFGIGLGRAGIGMSTPSSYNENQYNKLVIEFINPASKSIIWRSISQNKLTDTMSAQQRNDFIVKEIALMLSDYPPQTKQP